MRDLLLDLLHSIWPFAFLFGGAGLFHAMREYAIGECIASWPATEGIIIHSKLRKGRGLGLSRSGSDRGPRVWRPIVTYQYEIDGKKFTRTRVQHGIAQRDMVRERAAESIAPYSPGTGVTVYYNPENPSQSALQPGVAPFWKQTVLFSILLIILGIVGAFFNAC